MNSVVPTIDCRDLSMSRPVNSHDVARPRSPTLIRPVHWSTYTFYDLRSRCIIMFLWRYSKAYRIYRVQPYITDIYKLTVILWIY